MVDVRTCRILLYEVERGLGGLEKSKVEQRILRIRWIGQEREVGCAPNFQYISRKLTRLCEVFRFHDTKHYQEAGHLVLSRALITIRVN